MSKDQIVSTLNKLKIRERVKELTTTLRKVRTSIQSMRNGKNSPTQE